jgi:hypothetical protein
MSLKFAKPKVAASAVRKDKKREIREAVVVDAETEGEGHDLMHGEGGTLGLGDGEDLNKDD